MPRSLKLLAAAAVTAVALAGCSSSAKVTLGDGKGSPFCTDVGKFQDQAHTLEAAAGGDLAGMRSAADATRDQLVVLQKEANPADRVNGHAVKDDLAVAVETYKALAGGLDTANASDPNAVTNVLASVKDKEGGAFTASSGRLDAYAKQGCGIAVTAATTSTVTPAPTTSAPSGSSTTAAPAVGPVVATTTTSTP